MRLAKEDKAIWHSVLQDTAIKCETDVFTVDSILKRAYPNYNGKNINYFLDMPNKHFQKEVVKTIRRALASLALESGDSRGALLSPPTIAPEEGNTYE
jgi:hypothetical protein